jgi:hypothetical protein
VLDRARFVACWGRLIIGMGVVTAFVEGYPIVGAVLVALWAGVAALARRNIGPAR